MKPPRIQSTQEDAKVECGLIKANVIVFVGFEIRDCNQP